jgi:tetraprenyl-beta-curcumene synthase
LGTAYWLEIYPQVQRELAGWKRYAQTIPDPVLRAQALHKLTVERLNPEAAAFFAVLAPRHERPGVVRLIVAYQLLYDYLDAVNELPGCTSLRNGLQLHRALVDAVLPDRQTADYYRHNLRCKDGGYLHALAETCKRLVRTLAASARIESLLLHAVQRVGEAQSHNHAIASDGEGGLVAWCLQHATGGDYLWWEVAAGGISCLAIHALFALAADPASTIEDAARVDAAYFPPVCAISALLDSLADHYSDLGTTNHSFTARYRDSAHAAERFVAIAAHATDLISALRNDRSHAIILAGIVVFYLSSPTVRAGFPVPVADGLARSIGPITRPMCAVMRLRRGFTSYLRR